LAPRLAGDTLDETVAGRRVLRSFECQGEQGLARVFPLEEPLQSLDPSAQLFDLRETLTPENSGQLVAAAEAETDCETVGRGDAASGAGE